MSSPLPRANDLGVLYSKNGTGAGTYTDIAGVSQAKGTLTSSFTEQVTAPLGIVDYSHPWLGESCAISIFVDIALVNGASVKVKLQGRYDAAGVWTDMQLVRQDTGVIAAEQNLTAGTFLLQTASILAVSQIRVVAAGVSGEGFLLGDSVVVKAWVQ